MKNARPQMTNFKELINESIEHIDEDADLESHQLERLLRAAESYIVRAVAGRRAEELRYVAGRLGRVADGLRRASARLAASTTLEAFASLTRISLSLFQEFAHAAAAASARIPSVKYADEVMRCLSSKHPEPVQART